MLSERRYDACKTWGDFPWNFLILTIFEAVMVDKVYPHRYFLAGYTLNTLM